MLRNEIPIQSPSLCHLCQITIMRNQKSYRLKRVVTTKHKALLLQTRLNKIKIWKKVNSKSQLPKNLIAPLVHYRPACGTFEQCQSAPIKINFWQIWYDDRMQIKIRSLTTRSTYSSNALLRIKFWVDYVTKEFRNYDKISKFRIEITISY